MTKKLTIEDMHALALYKNGKFLSNEYINALTNHTWQCEFGHVWDALPNNIKNGQWCRKCFSETRKNTIEDMHNFARERGGYFLSKIYINSQTKYDWQCKEGHRWSALANSVMQGSWCLICCGKEKLTIQDMNALALSKNGKFLSNEYINTKTKYNWQCSENHIWSATANDVKRDIWCGICGGFFKRTIKDMHVIAKEKGGCFLSKNYTTISSKYLWECNEGHIWESVANHVKNGSWCPHCHKPSRGEEICREVISKIFGEPFIRCRPNFLRYTNGRNLELDGYCEKLNMAFEYHGGQHFKSVEYFGGEENFADIQMRDKTKIDMCIKHGVKLIVVPTFPFNFYINKCKKIINEAFVVAGVEMPRA